MSEKVPNLNTKFQKLLALGLWPKSLSPPDPQTLERIYKLDLDLYNRLYNLSVPDDGTLDHIKAEYHSQSRKKRQKKIVASQPRGLFQFLGEGVSAMLNHEVTDDSLLKKLKLPVLNSPTEVATFLEIDEKKLVGIIYHRRSNNYAHYIDFTIPKKSGGVRHISAPKPYLKRLQYKIKEQILDQLKLPKHVYGFSKRKTIFTNAKLHVDGEKLVNVDIKNFFPSIHFYRVRHFFHTLGYSGQVATILALLTTKQGQKKVEVAGKTYYAFTKERFLPQGAPSSPMISTMIALPMDMRIIERLTPLGCIYSRYVDDITVSSEESFNVRAVVSILHRTLRMHGFIPNPKKFKILGITERQEVTGLIINSGEAKIPRVWRRNLRAAVHNFVTKGEGNPIALLSSIAYLKKTHPKHAKKLLKMIQDAI
ncbi:MAG: RNA-directed DNA polymerase [Candidatus Heimdallarchaeota archaeon]|nr:RNA-directed DNA polymerase [Candidatus Heimdallarchaeota archaeon]